METISWVGTEGDWLPVLGHFCAELERFQAAGEATSPFIESDGTVVALEGATVNPVPIVFCPFCGTRLQQEASRGAH